MELAGYFPQNPVPIRDRDVSADGQELDVEVAGIAVVDTVKCYTAAPVGDGVHLFGIFQPTGVPQIAAVLGIVRRKRDTQGHDRPRQRDVGLRNDHARKISMRMVSRTLSPNQCQSWMAGSKPVDWRISVRIHTRIIVFFR